MSEETAEQPMKRRGRPSKVRNVQPEGVDAPAEELVTAPVAKPRPPAAPLLAKEIVDYVLGKYDMLPGDFRMMLNVCSYISRLGRHWSLETRR